jgi:hypothetical protein
MKCNRYANFKILIYLPTAFCLFQIVDPWGTIVAQCSDRTGIAMADVSLDFIQEIRREMPVSQHKRPDLYLQSQDSLLPADDEKFQFGRVVIQGNTIFYKTNSTIAFTNKKCVVPGRILFDGLIFLIN